jgi:hypothetical protein
MRRLGHMGCWRGGAPPCHLRPCRRIVVHRIEELLFRSRNEDSWCRLPPVSGRLFDPGWLMWCSSSGSSVLEDGVDLIPMSCQGSLPWGKHDAHHVVSRTLNDCFWDASSHFAHLSLPLWLVIALVHMVCTVGRVSIVTEKNGFVKIRIYKYEEGKEGRRRRPSNPQPYFYYRELLGVILMVEIVCLVL